MLEIIRYKDLVSADLLVDAVFEGEAGSKLSGEPLTKLIPGNWDSGGLSAFRKR